jgi:hypothetical protein
MKAVFQAPTEAYWHSVFSKAQYGGGISPFKGRRFQRGGGLGDILKSLFRFIVPIGKAVGLKALETGGHVAADLASGEDIKSSLKKRGKRAAKSLIQKGTKRIVRKLQTGKGLGIRGRNKAPIKQKRLRKSFKRKRPNKRDALGNL